MFCEGCISVNCEGVALKGVTKCMINKTEESFKEGRRPFNLLHCMEQPVRAGGLRLGGWRVAIIISYLSINFTIINSQSSLRQSA